MNQYLEHHISRIHELRNCETCPYCGKIYSRLKAHVLTCPVRHPVNDRPRIPCEDETCDKSFLDRTYLKRHMEKAGHSARHQVQYMIQNVKRTKYQIWWKEFRLEYEYVLEVDYIHSLHSINPTINYLCYNFTLNNMLLASSWTISN